MVLEEFDGDVREYEQSAQQCESVIRCQTSENGITMGFLDFVPTDITYEVFSRLQQSPLVVERPFQLTDDGIEILVGGNPDAMQDLYEVLPESVETNIIEIQQFVPSIRRSYSSLTARQQEILETAIEMGFYDNPRRATYEDIANELDLSSSTVGEHVRKIERTVFSSLMEAVS
jgi:predicted DNA binding protein